MAQYSSVLVVDDDPTQIAIMTSYFMGLGIMNIHSALDPTVALEKLSQHFEEIDLIVSDLQMPQMDGLEFLRHLKAMKYAGKLAIFSGVEKNLLEHAGRLAKMHNLDLIGQLNKPINKQMLDAVFLDPAGATNNTATRRRTIITQDVFSAALSDGHIRPHYQPKVDINSGRIIGAESLARWEMPDGGFISPEDFIDFAERNGRIEELTMSLYDQVLQDTATFLRVDPSQRIAVNISPRLLNNVSLPDRLIRRLRTAGLQPANIGFEVTENSILNLDATTLEVLSRLRIHDFTVAIDDFGTGSSNIQALRDFPYTELKVDRAFVSKAYESDFSAQTMQMAVSFAKQMNMITVAEGVEDQHEWDFAKKVGIDHVQGYFVSKALPPLSYLDFLQKHQNASAAPDLEKVQNRA